MNKQMNALVFCAVTLFAPLVAVAGGGMDVKPGLWEIQHQAKVDGQAMPDMQKQMAEAQKQMEMMKSQMANMPPEMQERMKAMMPQGSHMGMTDKGITICLTQEQINRSEVAQDPDRRCKTTDIQQSGNKTTIKMRCDAPNEGDMVTEVERISDSEWKSVSHMKMGQRTVDSSGHGKWLKTDCGDVKPMGEKPGAMGRRRNDISQ